MTTTKKSASTRELKARGIKAAARYLELMGYDVLETKYKCDFGKCDIIAREDDALVFVRVVTSFADAQTNMGNPFSEWTVQEYERVAMHYLENECDDVDFIIRFDAIMMRVVGEDRAFLKHLVNAVNGDSKMFA